jgi:hypothetical protein
MEMAAGLIKLNPDSNSKVDEWRDTMKSRMDEALATLVHEGAEIESWFRIKIEGQDYLLWYMRAESMKKVFEVSRTFRATNSWPASRRQMATLWLSPCLI